MTGASSSRRLVTILEPGFGGHRYEYVAHLVRGALLDGHQPVLITTADGRESVEFATHLAGYLPDRLTVRAVPVPHRVRRWEATWVLSAAVWHTRRSRTLIVPHGDRYLPHLMLMSLCCWRISMLAMRPSSGSRRAWPVAMKETL